MRNQKRVGALAFINIVLWLAIAAGCAVWLVRHLPADEPRVIRPIHMGH